MSHGKTLSIKAELRDLDERRHARLEGKLDRLISEVRSGFDMLDPIFDARHFDSIIDGFENRMTIRFLVYCISQGILTAAMILWMIGTLR
ncbi:MAG TPA: hypothetical protein VKQ05_06330 [Gemmatimonadales bacterium]|nr:hypothetical protein [Gemmatimonadales bacterium]